MSGAPNDDELDYLLSRGMLSGPKRTEILERAIASSRLAAPAPRRWRRLLVRGVGAGLAAAAGAALVVVVARPAHEAVRFRTKGTGVGAPILELTCVGATLKACPRGALLAFSVWNPGDGGQVPGFVSSYSDPTSSGERIWYLVNEPLVRSVVSTVARIGDEHRPGSYRAEVVLSRRPLARAEVLAARTAPTPDITTRAEFQLEVLP